MSWLQRLEALSLLGLYMFSSPGFHARASIMHVLQRLKWISQIFIKFGAATWKAPSYIRRPTLNFQLCCSQFPHYLLDPRTHGPEICVKPGSLLAAIETNSASEPSASQLPNPGTLSHLFPPNQQHSLNTQTFKRRLKTFLFCKSHSIPTHSFHRRVADWLIHLVFIIYRLCFFPLYFIRMTVIGWSTLVVVVSRFCRLLLISVRPRDDSKVISSLFIVNARRVTRVVARVLMRMERQNCLNAIWGITIALRGVGVGSLSTMWADYS